MRFRLHLLLSGALVFLASSNSFAGVTIAQPTTNTTWTAGKNETIKFSYDRGCSGGSAKIRVGLIPLFYTSFGVQSGSPVYIPLKVPSNSQGPGKSEKVLFEISITQADGTTATDQVYFTITNP